MSRKKGSGRRGLVAAAKIGIAVLILGLLAYSGQLEFHNLRRAEQQPVWLVAGFGLIAIILSLAAVRWYVLLRSQGFDRTLWEVVRLTFVGIFFNSFMPGAVGGDFVKAVYIAREEPKRRTGAVLSVLIDRIVGLSALTFIALFAALPNWGLMQEKPELAGMVGLMLLGVLGGVIGALLLISRRVGEWRLWKWVVESLPGGSFAKKVREALKTYRSVPGSVGVAFGLSVVAHGLMILCIYCLGRALGSLSLTLGQHFLLIPFGLLANAIPISFGGLGVGEAAFETLYELASGAAENLGGEVALLMHACFFIWNFVLGGLFFVSYRSVIRDMERPVDEGEESPQSKDM